MRLAIVLPVLLLIQVSCGGAEDDGGDGGGAVTTVPDTSNEAVVCEPNVVDGDLFLYNWTEYIDPGLVSEFEMEFGVEVIIDTYDSNEALLTKLQSGAVYDLVVPSDYMVTAMIEQGLLSELQKSAVPNLGNLKPRFRSPVYDPGGAHSVAYQYGTTGLGVDLALLGDGFEPSWSLVFDADTVLQHAGGVELLDDSRETMGAALKYLGYSLNSQNESELQEAADLLAGVSEYVSTFRDEGSSGALSGDGVSVVHLNSKFRLTDGEDEGKETRFAYVVPLEGASLWVDSMTIPTNAEHSCTAHAFINFILDPDNGGALSNWNRLASPNWAAEEFLLAEILGDEAIYPPEEVWIRLEILVDTGDFENRYDEYFAIARG